MTPTQTGYRSDIDGLRALAVVAVILFHLEIEPFSGGFVGVDVFFVISGFLITRLILSQTTEGGFSFSKFYRRRLRRLFPAFFVTLAVSFLAAGFLFSPQDLERFAHSLVYAVLCVSNFFFWSEAGYFDISSQAKPLLHVWSLSVEEQFYFVWPALLALLVGRLRSALIPAVLILAGAVSVLAAQFWLPTDPDGAFYLMPFRFFEFAIGATLVWLIPLRKLVGPALEAVAILGLGLIVYPVFAFSSATTFPGLAALVPCLGTGLLIYCGDASRVCRPLRSRPVVALGLVSYSLYLIHWPLLVFYRYWRMEELGPGEKTALFGLSVLISVAMYRGIERPFRANHRVGRGSLSAGESSVGGGDRRFVSGAAVLAGALLLTGWHAWTHDGWLWRLPAEVARFVDFDRRFHDENVGRAFRESAPTRFNDDRPNVWIVGDSHAQDFFNTLAFSAHAERFNLKGFGFPHYCRTLVLPEGERESFYTDLTSEQRGTCRQIQESFLTSPLIRSADYLILAGRWNYPGAAENLSYLRYTIEVIRKQFPGKLVLLSNKAEFADVPRVVIRHGLRGGVEEAVSARRDLGVEKLNGALEEALGPYVDGLYRRDRILCPRADFCHVFDGEGRLIVYDYGHFTLAGARFVGGLMEETGFFDAIFSVP